MSNVDDVVYKVFLCMAEWPENSWLVVNMVTFPCIHAYNNFRVSHLPMVFVVVICLPLCELVVHVLLNI